MWTRDRIDHLTRRWREGASARDIALELGGISRNAVIGKVHRLGLRGSRSISDNERNRRLAQQRTVRLLRAMAAEKRQKRPPGPPRVPVEPRVSAGSRPVSTAVATVSRVVDLEPHHCRWPVGEPGTPDFGFCGRARVHGHSYCAECCVVAYQVPTPRAVLKPVFSHVKPAETAVEPA